MKIDAPHRKKLWRGFLVGLIALLSALGLEKGGALERWEARTWDWRAQALAPLTPAHPDIVLIMLDQNSLDWAQRQHALTWPWPRELYGAIIDFCRRGGARALAFDLLFLEPSAHGVADDLVLSEAIAAFGPFVGAVFLGETTGVYRQWPEHAPPPPWSSRELAGPPPPAAASPAAPWLREFSRAALPIPEVALPAILPGNVQLAPDADSIYRRTPLFAGFDGRAVPVLGLAPYLAAHPEAVVRRQGDHLQIGPRLVPLDREGRTLLRYRGPAGSHRAYSAAAVLQGEIRLRHGEESPLSPEVFRDKYVFFGTSAPGLYDLRPTPMGGLYSGVEIHATILDNLLAGDFMRPTPVWFNLAVTALLTLGGAMLLSLLVSTGALLLTAGLLLTLPVPLALAAYCLGWWLPLVLPGLGAAGAVLLALLANYVTEGRQKRFIKSAFGQYLSPAVIEQLLRHPERLKLGGERRELSIFFSDLQGFTSISEGLEPEVLTALLNDYLSAMTAIIQQEGGTVDKYGGDSIVAFWNAPLPVPDHAWRALWAARRCQKRLALMREQFKARCGHELHMRIGINTGPAVVGNLGSASRFDYTMLGDAVNLAARLEGANKEFGLYTLISETTCRAVQGRPTADGSLIEAIPPLLPGGRDTGSPAGPVFLREIGRLAVVGRREPVTVFEPLTPEQAATRPDQWRQFARARHFFYRGDFAGALPIFTGLQDYDPAAAAYAGRCRQLLAEPPPAEWQGVWRMSGK